MSYRLCSDEIGIVRDVVLKQSAVVESLVSAVRETRLEMRGLKALMETMSEKIDRLTENRHSGCKRQCQLHSRCWRRLLVAKVQIENLIWCAVAPWPDQTKVPVANIQSGSGCGEISSGYVCSVYCIVKGGVKKMIAIQYPKELRGEQSMIPLHTGIWQI